MSNFAIIRLGKDSVADIRILDSYRKSPASAIEFTVSCTQVPQDLQPNDYVFVCLGSDNNKGIATSWQRGLRAIGTVTAKKGGPNYNDDWQIDIVVKVILPKSVAQKELLAKAPVAYYWCCDIPVLGVDTHSNQTVQMIKDKEVNQNVAALVYCLSAIFSDFYIDAINLYPEFKPLFAYEPPSPVKIIDRDENYFPLFKVESLDALVTQFQQDSFSANLFVNRSTIMRFVTSLLSKKFLIITGLAGSGKTKLAQTFAKWVTPDPGWIDAANRFKGKKINLYSTLLPVGADWIGNDNILGYPNGLDKDTYMTKPALELICHALENISVPHFLILDEMNLSHVERYFADLLSAIESGEEIPLYEGEIRKTNGKDVPKKLSLPSNLFIIGTVNVDETTYMFSPKVLDRANVIEFRMEPTELATFLADPKAPKLADLDGKGTIFGEAFVNAAADKSITVPAAVKAEYEQEMLLFFDLLHQHSAEFGYRVAYEVARFIHFYKVLGGYGDEKTGWFVDAMDAVIVQKFLPKLHGSRSKLEGLLWALAWACAEKYTNATDATLVAASEAQDETKYGPEVICRKLKEQNKSARYPLSFAKVMRMWRKLVRDQFVTFAEA